MTTDTLFVTTFTGTEELNIDTSGNTTSKSKIKSANSNWELAVKSSGNLVLTDITTGNIGWDTKTTIPNSGVAGGGVIKFKLYSNGLELTFTGYATSTSTLYSTRSQANDNDAAKLTVTNDGNLIIKNNQDTIRWTLSSQRFNFSGVTGYMLDIAVSPLDQKLYCAATNKNVYVRDRQGTQWNLVPNSCCVTSIDFDSASRLQGVGNDYCLYYKSNSDVTSSWNLLANSSFIIGITLDRVGGTYYGVGKNDNSLYYWTGSNWLLKGSISNLLNISCDSAGLMWAVKTDKTLIKQNNRANLSSLTDFSAQNVSDIIAVGTDKLTNDVYVVKSDNTIYRAAL